MIFLDTNVLSLIFRRNQIPDRARPLRDRLGWLAEAQKIAVPALVVQELLSGVRHKEQFDRICSVVDRLPVLPTSREQHIAAAQLSNRCSAAGVATHVTDALLAALALEADGWVLTEDPDFQHMARCCGVQVLSVEQALHLTATV